LSMELMSAAWRFNSVLGQVHAARSSAPPMHRKIAILYVPAKSAISFSLIPNAP
jgi:hypothetical protein